VDLVLNGMLRLLCHRLQRRSVVASCGGGCLARGLGCLALGLALGFGGLAVGLAGILLAVKL
jgi:hypothetical protein